MPNECLVVDRVGGRELAGLVEHQQSRQQLSRKEINMVCRAPGRKGKGNGQSYVSMKVNVKVSKLSKVSDR